MDGVDRVCSRVLPGGGGVAFSLLVGGDMGPYNTLCDGDVGKDKAPIVGVEAAAVGTVDVRGGAVGTGPADLEGEDGCHADLGETHEESVSPEGVGGNNGRCDGRGGDQKESAVVSERGGRLRLQLGEFAEELRADAE